MIPVDMPLRPYAKKHDCCKGHDAYLLATHLQLKASIGR